MTNEWDALPDTITTFLTALDAREVDRAVATFIPDAVVTDEGRDYTGRDAIAVWLAAAAGEYTYTTEFTGASTTDTTAVVKQHLEGDFPGGVADLQYRFALDGGLISRLVIEP
jgi:ketosteroid isomerase-like protein